MKAILSRPHTHGRIHHPAGASLDVTPAEHEWLRQHDLVVPEAVPVAIPVPLIEMPAAAAGSVAGSPTADEFHHEEQP